MCHQLRGRWHANRTSQTGFVSACHFISYDRIPRLLYAVLPSKSIASTLQAAKERCLANTEAVHFESRIDGRSTGRHWCQKVQIKQKYRSYGFARQTLSNHTMPSLQYFFPFLLAVSTISGSRSIPTLSMVSPSIPNSKIARASQS